MVSFSCDSCQETIKKPKLKQHSQRCGDSFTCIDCSASFGSVNNHTSCIPEHEKYQKHIYKKQPAVVDNTLPAAVVNKQVKVEEKVENLAKPTKNNLIAQLQLKKQIKGLGKKRSLYSIRKKMDKASFDLLLKKIKIGPEFLD